MHSPYEAHMNVVYKILQYLKGTPRKGLQFGKHDQFKIEAFTDVNWVGSIEDRRSTSGYCTFVFGNLITWRSKNQNVVARSSAEAEFRSIAHGICEVLWIKRVLEELKIRIHPLAMMYCDNKATISISYNPVHHDRTKHVEVDCHFIKEKIEQREICLTYVPSKSQIADVLTKGILRENFENNVDKLGMIDIYAPT